MQALTASICLLVLAKPAETSAQESGSSSGDAGGESTAQITLGDVYSEIASASLEDSASVFFSRGSASENAFESSGGGSTPASWTQPSSTYELSSLGSGGEPGFRTDLSLETDAAQFLASAFWRPRRRPSHLASSGEKEPYLGSLGTAVFNAFEGSSPQVGFSGNGNFSKPYFTSRIVFSEENSLDVIYHDITYNLNASIPEPTPWSELVFLGAPIWLWHRAARRSAARIR